MVYGPRSKVQGTGLMHTATKSLPARKRAQKRDIHTRFSSIEQTWRFEYLARLQVLRAEFLATYSTHQGASNGMFKVMKTYKKGDILSP